MVIIKISLLKSSLYTKLTKLMIFILFNACICHISLISDPIYAFHAHIPLKSVYDFICSFMAMRVYPYTKLSLHIIHGGFCGNEYTGN